MAQNKPIMPDQVPQADPDNIVVSVTHRIEDEIADAKTLRGWRKPMVCVLGVASLLLYAVLFGILFCPCSILRNENFQHGAVVIVVLATIPTVILLVAAKAVFGKTSGNASYTPMEGLLRILKELKSPD